MSLIIDQRPLLASLEIEQNPIDDRLKRILRGAIEGHNWQKSWTSLGVKTALSLCGFMGRVPYFPQMQQLANGNFPLSIFYQTISLPVYSTDYIWSSIRMVDEIQARHLIGSQEVTDAGFKCSQAVCHTLKIGVPILLGIMAQIPLMALAWKYNPHNPAMVALTSMDAVMPIYSAYMLLALWSKKCQRQTDLPEAPFLQNLEELKQDLLLKRFDRLTLLLHNSNSFDEQVDSLNTLLHEPLEEAPVVQDTACKQASIFAAKASGVLFTAFFLAWLGVFSYEGAAHLYDDPTVDSLVTIFAVGINAALMGSLFIDTHLQIAKTVEDWVQKKRSITFISEAISPKLSSKVKVACIAFVLFQSMAAIQISRNYLPQEYVIPNAVFLSLAFMIPAYFPVRQLSDWGLQELYLHKGTLEQKSIVGLYQKLERLSYELCEFRKAL